MATGSAMTNAIGTPISEAERDRLIGIATTVTELLSADQVTLWTYDEPAGGTTSGMVSWVGGARWDGQAVELPAERWAAVPVVDLPTFSLAVSTGKVASYTETHRPPGRQGELMGALSCAAFDCEPVFSGGRQVGLMMVAPPRMLDTERAVLLPVILEEAAYLLAGKEMERYREEAGFLLRLIERATSERTVEHVLAVACEEVARRLGARHATVFLAGDGSSPVEPEGGAIGLVPVMCKRANGTRDRKTWRFFDDFAPRIAIHLQSWALSPVPLEMHAAGWWEDSFGAGRLIGASIRDSAGSIGALVVDRDGGHDFTRAESYLVHEVAGVIGWLVAWSRTPAEQLRVSNGKTTSTPWLLGPDASESRNTDEVISAVCAAAGSFFGTEVVHPIAATHALDTGFPALPPIRESLATGRVVASDDMIASYGPMGTPVLRSALAIPLGTGGQPWYVVACGSPTEPRPWSEQDMRLASQLASEGSLRLEMARLARVDRHQVGRLARRLLRDRMTGLPNAVLLVDRIEQAIHRATRDRAPLALICVDIDRLRDVNESLGESVGDNLLAQAAERLSSSLRVSDVVARVGGDEFAILLTTSATAEGTRIVLDKIQRVLSLPFELSGEIVMVTSKTAVTWWPQGGDDPAALLSSALDAVQRSRVAHPQAPPPGPLLPPPTTLPVGWTAAGTTIDSSTESTPALPEASNGSHAVAWDPPALPEGWPVTPAPSNAAPESTDGSDMSALRMDIPVHGQIPPHIVLTDLPAAIDDGQLVLHYLPTISLIDDDVISMEALVRWEHPLYGLVPPSAFLPLVEESELGWKITHWVLTRAMEQCAEWLAAGLSLAVTVNVSSYDVTVAPIIDTVQDLLARTSLLGRHLTLEISEQAVMDELVRGSAALVILRGNGVRISIDDCGSGKVAPLYLARMPVDEIKIDNRLLMETDPSDIELVRDIVRLGHEFGIKLTAEAVEGDDRAGGMERLGVDNMQGFHVAPPLLAGNVPSWVSNHRARTNNERNVLWTG